MHLAPLSLLIVCELLLFWAERFTPLSPSLHFAVFVAIATAIFAISTTLRKRETRVLTGLRLEVASMQQKVAMAARRYKSLLEGAGNAIFVFHAESGQLEEANRMGMELLGFSQVELACLVGRDLLPPSEHERFRTFLLQLKRRGWADSDGLQFQRKDGSLFLGEITARLIDLGDERVVHCILRDITERTRLFEELNWKGAELLRSHRLLEKTSHNLSVSEIKLKRNLALVEQANLDLSRLDRMKNQFLGMVSHEFNTPLTGIISGSDYLLQQEYGGEEGAEVLQMVRDGGLRLKELVADLLRLIRLEAGGGELEPSAIHLERFLETMKDQLRQELDERRQTVRLTALDALPFFDGDRGFLERVFGELLLNAMKFSPEGGEIEVTGRVVDRGALSERRETLERFNADFLGRCGDRCYLEVEVRDHGTGIPADEQQGIFEIFYEVGEIRHHSSGASRLHGKGAGLGLAIVKGMVEAHGGMVWVESLAGSSFFLVLPLEQEASQAELF